MVDRARNISLVVWHFREIDKIETEISEIPRLPYILYIQLNCSSKTSRYERAAVPPTRDLARYRKIKNHKINIFMLVGIRRGTKKENNKSWKLIERETKALDEIESSIFCKTLFFYY